jgi:hypothetical protein
MADTGRAELAGNLKAELLDVRLGLKLGEINEMEAYQRLKTIRRRRLMAQEELMRMPAVEAGVLQAASN